MFEPQFPAVLDSTILKDFQRCEYSAFEKYILGKRDAEDMQFDLNVGKAVAKGIEAGRKAFYFGGADPFEAMQTSIIALEEAYGPDPHVEHVKSLQKCRDALRGYFSVYPFDLHSGIVPVNGGAEYTFSFPLADLTHPDTGEPLLYSGRFDMIGKQVGGDVFGLEEERESYWICDEKTAKSTFGGNWMFDYDLDWQFLGYKKATEVEGKYNIEGAKIRKILLGKKVINPMTDFPEITVYFTPQMVEQWWGNCQLLAERFIHSYVDYKDWKENRFIKAYGNACNEYKGCDYRSICQNNPQPEWKEVRWNPLSSGE